MHSFRQKKSFNKRLLSCNRNVVHFPFSHRSRAVKGNIISVGSHISVNWANDFSSSFSEIEDWAALDIFMLISSTLFSVNLLFTKLM